MQKSLLQSISHWLRACGFNATPDLHRGIEKTQQLSLPYWVDRGPKSFFPREGTESSTPAVPRTWQFDPESSAWHEWGPEGKDPKFRNPRQCIYTDSRMGKIIFVIIIIMILTNLLRVHSAFVFVAWSESCEHRRRKAAASPGKRRRNTQCGYRN